MGQGQYNDSTSLPISSPSQQVIEMASLAEFDILRDTRQDIRQLPWAQSANREAMNLYFGIKRANEEILRLNVEIRRLVTSMLDAHCHLYSVIQTRHLSDSDPVLAHELSRRWQFQQKIHTIIAEQLVKTSKLTGFTGSLQPGRRMGHRDIHKDNIPLPQWANEILGLAVISRIGDDADTLDGMGDDENLNSFVEYIENLEE
jgi:hypothetical protein